MIYSQTFTSDVELTNFLNRKGIGKNRIIQITEVRHHYASYYTLFYEW